MGDINHMRKFLVERLSIYYPIVPGKKLTHPVGKEVRAGSVVALLCCSNRQLIILKQFTYPTQIVPPAMVTIFGIELRRYRGN
jgi:hypothetical protein